MVILFLFVAIGFALVSLFFCIFNARKVPYQSIKGHKGLYLWNLIAGMSRLLTRNFWNTFYACFYDSLKYALLFAALFGALGVLCFLAAMRCHSLTERVANYKENLFVLVVLDDSLDWSFWLGVSSIATHFAVCGVVAMSRIKLPKPEIKKPEEPTISALDLLYWRTKQRFKYRLIVDLWSFWLNYTQTEKMSHLKPLSKTTGLVIHCIIL